MVAHLHEWGATAAGLGPMLPLGLVLALALVQAVAYLHGGVLRLEDARPGLRAALELAHAEDAD